MEIDTFDVLAEYMGAGCGATPTAVGMAMNLPGEHPLTVSFLMRAGELEYLAAEAHDRLLVRKIYGIRITAKIANSEEFIVPHQLVFPFAEKQLSTSLKEVSAEADYYYQRDNSVWFNLISPHGKGYSFHVTPKEDGDDEGRHIRWDTKTGKPRSAHILELLETWKEGGYPGTWEGRPSHEIPGGMRHPRVLDVDVPLYDTNWKTHEYLNRAAYPQGAVV